MFITIEGIDRAGKSTQVARLAAALGPGTEVLREPGGTDAGELMRGLLKDPEVELDPVAELLLFCAARAELVSRVIAPALAAGADVVCDRFVDSTIAYQGVGRGLRIERVEQVCRLAVGECMPELTVLLRVDPAVAARRGRQRLAAGQPDGSDRFEREGEGFQAQIAAAYDEIASREPERVVVIEAERDADAVHADVLAAVEERR